MGGAREIVPVNEKQLLIIAILCERCLLRFFFCAGRLFNMLLSDVVVYHNDPVTLNSNDLTRTNATTKNPKKAKYTHVRISVGHIGVTSTCFYGN